MDNPNFQLNNENMNEEDTKTPNGLVEPNDNDKKESLEYNQPDEYLKEYLSTQINMNENVSRRNSSIPNSSLGNADFILVEGPVFLRGRKVSVREKITNFGPWMKDKIKRCCTKKQLIKRFPVTQWLPKYSVEDGIGDLVAGITVGCTVILQAIAYSAIAGLSPQYGLYGSFIGALIYIFIGTSKYIPMGPTAMVSLFTYQTIKGHGPEFASVLTLLSGIIQLLMGALGFGIILDFISGPVSSGFTSAVSLVIVTSQMKDILAISGGGTTFITMWINILSNIKNTHYPDLIIGICSIIVSLTLRQMSKIRVGLKDEDDSLAETKLNCTQKCMNRFFWLLGTSRNFLIVIVSGFLGFYYYNIYDGKSPIKLVGTIPAGFPSVQFPFTQVTQGNKTYHFFDMVTIMGSGILVTPLMAILEQISICKAFSHGQSVDGYQEIMALGICNVASCFFQAYPVAGSISRTAVQSASGVRTPLVNIYTAVIAILSLFFLTPYFYYIPKACLAAIIIAAVIFMVEVQVVKPIYRSKKSDLVPGLVTFIACLILPMEIGFIIGVGVNLMFILYHSARPKLTMEIQSSRVGIDYLLLTPDRCLIFPSVDYVSNLVLKQSIKQGIPTVIDCSHIYGADFTAARVIEVLCQNFSKRNQPLFFYNLKPSVVAVFSGIQPKDFIVYYDPRELDHLLKQRSLHNTDNVETL